MIDVQSLRRDLLAECDDDYVGLWSVIRDVGDAGPPSDDPSLRRDVLQLLRELLDAGEIQAGYPTSNGGFEPLTTTTAQVLRQVEDDWPAGRRPTVGEGLWFTRAARR